MLTHFDMEKFSVVKHMGRSVFSHTPLCVAQMRRALCQRQLSFLLQYLRFLLNDFNKLLAVRRYNQK